MTHNHLPNDRRYTGHRLSMTTAVSVPVVNIKGRKSRATVENALRIVENLEHRAGKDAEGKTGDGVGILIQVSHKFFSKVSKYPRLFYW